jgi:transcriptional regulator with XRE-family HTH domain
MRLDTAIGQTLREIRTEQVLTLRQAASKSLVSIGHLSDLERVRREPSSQMLESIARGYGLPTSELLIRVIATLNKEEQKCSQ